MSMSSFLWYDVSGSVAADKGRNRKKPLVHMTRGFLVRVFHRSALLDYFHTFFTVVY